MRIPLDIPPGLQGDDTTFAAAGRWADCDNVRFTPVPQVRGGWESVISTALTGVCRAVLPWTENSGTLNLGFGTHSKLQLYQGGSLFDITPTLAMPAATRAGGLSVADASPTVTVTHPSHGLADGDTVIVSGGEYVGRILPSGSYTVTVVDADSYTITHGSNADLAVTLGSNPLTTASGSTLVTVTETAHKIANGTLVTISGASAVNGITPNGTFAVTVVDANTYTFNFTSAASGSGAGGGASVVSTVPASGGGAIAFAPQNAFTAGQIDGTGSVGYGTGGYGVGGYGEPSTADYFPRTWALAAWGQQLLASPRGGTIHAWENDTGTPASPLANAPRQVTHMVVASQDQVFALGCNEEVSGAFNPLCIRHSGVRQYEQWASGAATTAREYILPGGGRIVAGRVIGAYILVWTTQNLFLGTYVGEIGQVWRFDRIGQNCGLAGPNAAVIVGDNRAFWIGPDRQFYAYALGGTVDPIPCPIREAFADNLAASQADKIVASSISEFGEVRWDYPDARDGAGLENSRYVVLQVSGPAAGAWSRGVMARTAMVDAGPSLYPCGVAPDGEVYWHERGQSADGGAMSWYIESADQYLSEDRAMMVRGVRPDFKEQVGPIQLTLYGRQYPQGDETEQVAASALAPGDGKADFRMTAALFRLRFSGDSAPASCRIGKPMFEAAPADGR